MSREISRNGGYDRYRAALADEKAWNSAPRAKRCKLAKHPRLPRVLPERRFRGVIRSARGMPTVTVVAAYGMTI